MAHLVESMFYTREKPWHGLGTMVDEAPNSADALRIAGLDWSVIGKPIYNENGIEIPNYKANTRDSDNSVLGIVSDRYKIVNNGEAFAFTDELIGGDVRYDTAGSLREGRTIWLLAKMPDTEVVGDKVEPYLCFTNTHDGTGAVRVCMTPIRVVCNNTLNIALSGTKRTWSTKHIGEIEYKLHEARLSLELAGEYMYALDKHGEQLANTSLNNDQLREILDEMFPIKETDTERVKESVKKVKNDYMVCVFAPDLKKFYGTAWGALNAMCDMVTHGAPRRKTANYQENNWGRIMDGHVMIDTMATKIYEKTKVSV